MGLSTTSNSNSTGYDDIDNLNNSQNELYDKAYKEQQNIVNTQTQQTIDEINRNADKLNDETTKHNKALYADYQKQVNPYGNNAEDLYSSGLAGSGVAETTKTNLYNTYQKNRTDTLNTARGLLADYNAQITQAKQNGDIQLAQAALQLYTQKIDNLYKNYQLAQGQKQFDYQVERDKVSDNRWQQEFDHNKAMSDRNYNYQVDRDKIADSQWQQQFDTSNNQWQQEFEQNKFTNDRNYNYQVGRDQVADSQFDRQFNYQQNRDQVSDSQWLKEFELQKKNSVKSSSRGSSSRASNSTSGNSLNVNSANFTIQKSYTPEEILSNISMVQGPDIANGIKDNISGKTFSSTDELLEYYGYAQVG